MKLILSHDLDSKRIFLTSKRRKYHTTQIIQVKAINTSPILSQEFQKIPNNKDLVPLEISNLITPLVEKTRKRPISVSYYQHNLFM